MRASASSLSAIDARGAVNANADISSRFPLCAGDFYSASAGTGNDCWDKGEQGRCES
jgi:hypothetical protein